MTNSLHHRADILQDRQGHKLASYLTLSANELPHHVSERLRVSRFQALSKRKLAKPGFAHLSGVSGNALTWGGDDGLGVDRVEPEMHVLLGLMVMPMRMAVSIALPGAAFSRLQ